MTASVLATVWAKKSADRFAAATRDANGLNAAPLRRAHRDRLRCYRAVFRDSPQFEAVALNNLFGCQLVLKIETLNPIRSFKGRGAQLLRLPEDG